MIQHVVPWFNAAEWLEVYDNLFSETSSLETWRKALTTLVIWKARCPNLVSGIESTLSLVEVRLQDKEPNVFLSDHVLRLAYSSALMRFVNHMLDSEQAKGQSLYQAAKKMNLPDWVINLRHEVAHSDSLPSLDLMRGAADIAIKWLHEKYWKDHKEVVSDYVFNTVSAPEQEDSPLSRVINFCMSLSICNNAQYKIKNVSDIPDTDMKQSIISEARELFDEYIDFSNLKTVSLSTLINLINTQAGKLLRTKNAGMIINKTLLDNKSLFISLEVLKLYNDREFYGSNRLPSAYLLCWEVLLSFLHRNRLILGLILELIEVTKDTNRSDHVRKLAAVWVKEIMRALRKSKLFLQKTNGKKAASEAPKKKKDQKMAFFHWYPNERHGLILDLTTPVPDELSDINYVQNIISDYNPYLNFFIKDCLSLLDPTLPKVAAERICKLANLISGQPKGISNLPKDQIFTIEDAKKEFSQTEYNNVNQNGETDCMEIDNEDMGIELQELGVWKLATGSHEWSQVPIGLLPWQTLPSNHT